ncbi:T9SS type A sorting domain-containing protein [bacterium]|nr:T9SS type A sorting domain-containing protein [bacterium]
MKRLKVLFLIAVLCIMGAQSAYATIGWAGDIWPLNGSSHLPTNDLTVYAKVWKSGVTDSPGQGADIEGWLYYKRASEMTYTALQMTYNVASSGSNDEYMGAIPAIALNGGENEDVYVVFKDLTDNTEYTDVRDQQGNGPNLSYVIAPGTSIDVAVTFRVDMNCVNPDLFAGGVFFTGDFELFWATCHPLAQMSDGDGDGIWEGTWVFPAGSNIQVQYKFQSHDETNCNWECGGNHYLILDDSQPTQIADVVQYCCETWGPGEISAEGSYCVGLCCCPNENWIRLNTQYNPPILSGVTIVPGCINCDGNQCTPGSGDVEWAVVQGGDMNWYIKLCIIDTDREIPVDGYAGCFCLTIDEILPVELNSFAAVGIENAVRVAWTTSSERNTDHFILDRSTDVNSWSQVAELEAAGNSQSSHHYTFTDNNVVVGTTYSYRLTVVDMDGSRTTHSSVASATPSNAGAVSEFALSQNYPNPFNPETSISYTLAEASRVSLKVYNIAGEEIATLVNGNENAGNHNVNFSAANLPTGLYFYRLDAGDFSATRKMMLLK